MQCPLERQSTEIERGQQCNGFTVNTTILHPQSVDISKSFVQLGGFLALLLLLTIHKLSVRTNQSINQSIKSINQSIHQSINQFKIQQIKKNQFFKVRNSQKIF